MSYFSALGVATDAISYFLQWQNANSDKPLDVKQIAINPMIAMAQLALLYHHPEGTKFDFANHQIVFFEPNLSQSVQRKKNGSSRDVVLRLKPLINTALQWYQPCKNAIVQRIFLRTIRGLKVLKRTYQDSDMVKSCIDGYIKDIAEACLKYTLKQDVINTYHRRVYDQGWKEVDRLTEILNDFPGDCTVFEFDEKLEIELAELQKQGGETVTGLIEESNHETESKVQSESSSSNAKSDAKTGKKDKTRINPSEGSNEKSGSTINKEPNQVNTTDKKPLVHAVMTAEARNARIQVITLTKDAFYQESLHKLMNEEVVPHIPSAEKMDKITKYLDGEITDLAKIVNEEVVNLLLFR